MDKLIPLVYILSMFSLAGAHLPGGKEVTCDQEGHTLGRSEMEEHIGEGMDAYVIKCVKCTCKSGTIHCDYQPSCINMPPTLENQKKISALAIPDLNMEPIITSPATTTTTSPRPTLRPLTRKKWHNQYTAKPYPRYDLPTETPPPVLDESEETERREELENREKVERERGIKWKESEDHLNLSLLESTAKHENLNWFGWLLSAMFGLQILIFITMIRLFFLYRTLLPFKPDTKLSKPKEGKDRNMDYWDYL